jgi:L-alanine-DL-glutamate epimerase-like enolase superfamily enzyme
VVAKVAGMPLHRLLGGFRNEVPVYGSGGWLDLDDDELVSEAERFVSSGMSAYKFKVGSPRDLERTRLLRRALGEDVTLLADANQRFDVAGAVETAAMLADFGVAWLEEPVLADSVDDLADVAARSPIPTAVGENSYFRWGFREICDRRAAAYLQPDVARCGGVTEFRKIAALAESYRLRLSSPLWHELSISLVGASPAGWAAEYTDLLPADLFTRPFDVTDGRISVPDVPGHGVEFDPAVIARIADDSSR